MPEGQVDGEGAVECEEEEADAFFNASTFTFRNTQKKKEQSLREARLGA